MPALDGRPIVITGASSGIGAAAALACARVGMPLVLTARRADRLDELAARIRCDGGAVETIAADVTEPGLAERLLDAARDAFGGIYAVFANAGYGEERSALDTGAARAMFEVNHWAALELVGAAVARMRTAPSAPGAPRGHLLLCSSCVSKIGLPMYAAYSATKAAMDHAGRALRHELAGDGIRVSTVHPIGTRTEFFDRAGERSGGLRVLDESRRGRLQPAGVVADAIVRDLRRPTRLGREVWTSTPARLGFALAVAFPALADAALHARFRRKMSARDG